MTIDTYEAHGSSISPTIGGIRLRLEQVLGDDFDSTWRMLCRKAGIPSDAVALDETDLQPLLAAIGGEGAICRVLSMSWRIRCTAARKLGELGR